MAARILAIVKEIVRGNKSSEGFVMFKALIKGCTIGSSKIRSGAVSAPRKGKTVPILKISINEESIIKNRSAQNCLRRRKEI